MLENQDLAEARCIIPVDLAQLGCTQHQVALSLLAGGYFGERDARGHPVGHYLRSRWPDLNFTIHYALLQVFSYSLESGFAVMLPDPVRHFNRAFAAGEYPWLYVGRYGGLRRWLREPEFDEGLTWR